MVDTGVGYGHERVEALFTPVHYPVEDTLQQAGVERRDVIMVINSHLHFDHCGNNRTFPGVPVVVQSAEYDLAHTEGYTIAEWVGPAVDWELVDGDAEVLPGLSVMATPGHTPGHQSVVVSNAEGLEVIAAQAVYDPGEFDSEASMESLTPAEAHATSSSARRIKALQPRRVFFSHDPRVWLATED